MLGGVVRVCVYVVFDGGVVWLVVEVVLGVVRVV